MTPFDPATQSATDLRSYRFGSYELRSDGTLFRGGSVVPMPAKELAILRLLVSRPQQIIAAPELRKAVWGNLHVSPDSLPRCLSSLRARLESEQCISTIYKLGYRFDLPVTETARVHEERSTTERLGSLTVSRLSKPPRLAILPFTVNGGLPENLGSMLAEDTMVALSQLNDGSMEVLAREPILSLVKDGAGHKELASTVEADYLLYGTISALPLHFRLRAELIRVSDDVQVWLEDFSVPTDRSLTSEQTSEESLTHRLGSLLAARVGGRIMDSLGGGARPATVRAWTSQASREQSYSEDPASDEWVAPEPSRLLAQIDSQLKGLEREPYAAGPRSSLAHCYLRMAASGYMAGDTAAELARRQAEISDSLSPHQANTRAALGWVAFYRDRNEEGAAKIFSEKHPGSFDACALDYRVRFDVARGCKDDAIAALREALVRDGRSPFLEGRLAWVLHLNGDRESALRQAERVESLYPSHAWAMLYTSMIYAAYGNRLAERATQMANRLAQTWPEFDLGYAALAYAHARRGQIIEARTLLERQTSADPRRFVMRSFHTAALVELGELDAALDELETAERHYCPYIFELLVDPRLSALHGEVRFQRLDRRLRANAAHPHLTNASVA